MSEQSKEKGELRREREQLFSGVPNWTGNALSGNYRSSHHLYRDASGMGGLQKAILVFRTRLWTVMYWLELGKELLATVMILAGQLLFLSSFAPFQKGRYM